MIADIIVVAVILISAVIAFLRGMIREVLTILGVVGGVIASYAGGPIAAVHIEKWLGVEEGVEPERLMGMIPYDILADIIAYGSIFIIVVIVLSILSHILAASAKALGLGAVDRTLGVVFGIARGILLLGLIYLPFHYGLDQATKEKWFQGSRTFFYLEQTSIALAKFVPESTKKEAEEQVKKLQEADTPQGAIDVLKQAREEEKPADGAEKPQDSEGYNDEFRDRMNELFDEKTDQNGAQNPAPQQAPPPSNQPPQEQAR